MSVRVGCWHVLVSVPSIVIDGLSLSSSATTSRDSAGSGFGAEPTSLKVLSVSSPETLFKVPFLAGTLRTVTFGCREVSALAPDRPRLPALDRVCGAPTGLLWVAPGRSALAELLAGGVEKHESLRSDGGVVQKERSARGWTLPIRFTV